MLWIHGGGFVIGTAAQDDALCRHFADDASGSWWPPSTTGWHRRPRSRSPSSDCYDGLVWLAGRPYVDATRIAVGGASAGGGLAAALALLARDRGDGPLAFQLLTYPMLDDRTACRTGHRRATLPPVEQQVEPIRLAVLHRPGAGFARDHRRWPPPPAATTCPGCPRLGSGWGRLDLFHDEDVDYAGRLEAAGVACTLDEVPGAFHGFDLVAKAPGVAKEFRAAQVAALAAALH